MNLGQENLGPEIKTRVIKGKALLSVCIGPIREQQ